MNHPSAHYYPHLQKFAFLAQTLNGRYAVAVDAIAKVGSPAQLCRRASPNKAVEVSSHVRVDRKSRMAERIEDLAAKFGHYFGEFEHRAVFGGPSVHFHVRAIERRMTHETCSLR